MAIIWADWPAPSHILAGVTDRLGGFSEQPFSSNNMGLHVGDAALLVAKNRAQLQQLLRQELGMTNSDRLKLSWQWLNQVHGIDVIEASHESAALLKDADAAVCHESAVVCSVMTADCLPILLCSEDGRHVAAIHAGWRSLCHGIIENTVAKLTSRSDQSLLAWFGPAIGAEAFEVGGEVKTAFEAQQAEASLAFERQDNGKYLADIYQLAALRLSRLGIENISGGKFCTYNEPERFFSYRKNHQTGRMVSFIVQIPAQGLR